VSTILCIDTASERFAIAVEREGRVTGFEAEAEQNHSRLLLPAIAELAGDAGRLGGIVVVTGPGAYAGIRVGIATAEGLALAHGCGVYGLGTLTAVAFAAEEDGAFAAIHPAGRGEFAVQYFTGREPAGLPAILRGSTPGTDSRGEGAARFGGREMSPLQRAVAALRELGPRIHAGELAAGADAFYMREPNITISRRQVAAAS